MLQFQQLALALINTGAVVSGICSSVGLDAGLYGVGRQCYSPVCISRQFQQLAPALINTGVGCTVGLGGVWRQCYSHVRISRRTQQLALVLINTGRRSVGYALLYIVGRQCWRRS